MKTDTFELIFDESYKSKRIFFKMNGRPITYLITEDKAFTTYHPFRTSRYITKWITSEKSMEKIREFVKSILK